MRQPASINKKLLLILACVTVGLLLLALLLTAGIGGHDSFLGEHPLYISELMTRNGSVPNADGVLCDWIELGNRSDSDFDASGYRLSDSLSGAKYAIPAGTVIPAHGFLVISCTEDYTGGLYAPFSLSRDGGETIVLMNSSNVVLDEVVTLPSRKNTAQVRASDGTLTLSAAPTPGYENSEEGRARYLQQRSSARHSIALSEAMSSNTLYANADSLCCDWIELTNTGSDIADIGGYMLSDKAGSARFSFPAGTELAPGGYIVVWCGSGESELYADFSLSRMGGESVLLCDAAGTLLEELILPALSANHSYARTENGWEELPYGTPGYENSEAGYAAYQASMGFDRVTVAVTEAAADNLAVLPDGSGSFPDWIELYNSGSSDCALSGWFLSDDAAEPDKWRFPAGTVIPAGGYLVVFASGAAGGDTGLHADFSLSAGETVYLNTPSGAVHSSLSLAGLGKGESAQLCNGALRHNRWQTPGFENSDAGYEAWQQSLAPALPLVINEVVTSNIGSFFQYNVGESDWVEIKNVSSSPVELSDYCLSCEDEQPDQWRLPSRTLDPGATAVFFCSGNESNSAGAYIHTNFTLSAAQESLFLTRTDGTLADYVYLHDIPAGGSCGRMSGQNGFFYFTKPTPLKENEEGFRAVTLTPSALSRDGVFNDCTGVTVELAGENIYYTTDGSYPTAAATPYTGPFTVTETSVVRAACIQSGKLTGAPLALSYIINEKHSLPVASLVASPSDLFYSGIYDSWWSGKQVPASISFYEEDGAFSAVCGIKMYGHTALKNDKRSFKLLFHPRFGAASLQYDLFDNGNTGYTSLVLRAGQDYPYSIFRDELMGQLCADFSDKVLVQAYKQCVLYLNGQYWGIYSFKEAFSEDYYAMHRQVDPDSVTLEQAPVIPVSPVMEAINLAKTHDMRDDANYDTFCSMVDIDSLIDWCIIEGYSANADVQQNLRYFRSAQNGNRWELAFYDLDWAFYFDGNNLTMVFAGVGEDGTVLQHSTYLQFVVQNEKFQDAFCRRLAEALSGPLSEASVLAEIDRQAERLAPEIPRERERWHTSPDWEGKVQELRDFVSDDWTRKMIDGACYYCGLTQNEREEYFGGVGA